MTIKEIESVLKALARRRVRYGLPVVAFERDLVELARASGRSREWCQNALRAWSDDVRRGLA